MAPQRGQQQETKSEGGQRPSQKKGPPKPDMASGVEVGSIPAADSTLPGGTASEPARLAEAVSRTGSEDWGRLEPRERHELLETFHELCPPRYRDQVETYFRRTAEEDR
jgi:hypothetical protein